MYDSNTLARRLAWAVARRRGDALPAIDFARADEELGLREVVAEAGNTVMDRQRMGKLEEWVSADAARRLAVAAAEVLANEEWFAETAPAPKPKPANADADAADGATAPAVIHPASMLLAVMVPLATAVRSLFVSDVDKVVKGAMAVLSRMLARSPDANSPTSANAISPPDARLMLRVLLAVAAERPGADAVFDAHPDAPDVLMRSAMAWRSDPIAHFMCMSILRSLAASQNSPSDEWKSDARLFQVCVGGILNAKTDPSRRKASIALLASVAHVPATSERIVAEPGMISALAELAWGDVDLEDPRGNFHRAAFVPLQSVAGTVSGRRAIADNAALVSTLVDVLRLSPPERSGKGHKRQHQQDAAELVLYLSVDEEIAQRLAKNSALVEAEAALVRAANDARVTDVARSAAVGFVFNALRNGAGSLADSAAVMDSLRASVLACDGTKPILDSQVWAVVSLLARVNPAAVRQIATHPGVAPVVVGALTRSGADDALRAAAWDALAAMCDSLPREELSLDQLYERFAQDVGPSNPNPNPNEALRLGALRALAMVSTVASDEAMHRLLRTPGLTEKVLKEAADASTPKVSFTALQCLVNVCSAGDTKAVVERPDFVGGLVSLTQKLEGKSRTLAWEALRNLATSSDPGGDAAGVLRASRELPNAVLSVLSDHDLGSEDAAKLSTANKVLALVASLARTTPAAGTDKGNDVEAEKGEVPMPLRVRVATNVAPWIRHARTRGEALVTLSTLLLSGEDVHEEMCRSPAASFVGVVADVLASNDATQMERDVAFIVLCYACTSDAGASLVRSHVHRAPGGGSSMTVADMLEEALKQAEAASAPPSNAAALSVDDRRRLLEHTRRRL